jgi:hypothetical protein
VSWHQRSSATSLHSSDSLWRQSSVAFSYIATTGELTSAHLPLLDMTVFRHTFHHKFNLNPIQTTHFIKHHTHTHIYMTITKVHTSIYMKKYYQSLYTCSSKFHTSNSWHSTWNGHELDTTFFVLYYTNRIGQSTYPAMWPGLWYLPLRDINSCIIKWLILSRIDICFSSVRWILGGSSFWAKIKTTNYAMNLGMRCTNTDDNSRLLYLRYWHLVQGYFVCTSRRCCNVTSSIRNLL